MPSFCSFMMEVKNCMLNEAGNGTFSSVFHKMIYRHSLFCGTVAGQTMPVQKQIRGWWRYAEKRAGEHAAKEESFWMSLCQGAGAILKYLYGSWLL